jgi:hypothetical protein
MTFSLAKFKTLLCVVICGAMVGDLMLYWSDKILREHLAHNPGYLYEESSILPAVPEGYQGNGEKISIAMGTAPGVVIRYASNACPHCRNDEPRWLELAKQLRAKHCIVLTLPTASQDAYPSTSPALAGGNQLTYVDTSWVRPLKLRGTPTVIIFSRNRGPIWGHEGELNEDDVRSALQAADAL